MGHSHAWHLTNANGSNHNLDALPRPEFSPPFPLSVTQPTDPPAVDADGICPDVGWRYRASHAPRAHHISAYASWQRTGGGEGLTAPNGGGGAIPSPLMCAVVLPRAVATDLAPSEIAAELKVP